jgi:hypothetical protein
MNIGENRTAQNSGGLNRFAVICDAARRCGGGFGRQLRYHRFRQAAAPGCFARDD